MGADIHIFAEVKKNGNWKIVEDKLFSYYDDKLTHAPFDYRSYGLFGFLANVRNYSHVPTLVEPRGLPDDSEYLNEIIDDGNYYPFATKESIRESLNGQGYHSFSHIYLQELIEFDYDKTFEDRRYNETVYHPDGRVAGRNGAAISEPGKGQITTFREFLGDSFFKDIEILKTLGNPEDVRIVFWFDN